jgi:hypothetical protein
MRHLLIALVIGLLTIGVSIFVLSDSDKTYDTDLKPDKSVALGSTYEGVNYDITPAAFDCQEYTSLDQSKERYGCILTIELTNTSVFDIVLIQGDDVAVAEDGTEFISSGELTTQYVPDNQLLNGIAVGETVTGGIFFDVTSPTQVKEVLIQELAGADPIIIKL